MAPRRALARMVQRLRNRLPGVQVFVVGIDQAVAPEELAIIPESVTPARLPDVFPSEEVSSAVLRFHINICGRPPSRALARSADPALARARPRRPDSPPPQTPQPSRARSHALPP